REGHGLDDVHRRDRRFGAVVEGAGIGGRRARGALGQAALRSPSYRSMDEPPSTELLLIACELASEVECRPQREDGTDAAVYASSGPTVARRIKAGAKFVASSNATPMAPGLCPAPFYWAVSMQVSAVRKTHYKLWLRESPEQVKD